MDNTPPPTFDSQDGDYMTSTADADSPCPSDTTTEHLDLEVHYKPDIDIDESLKSVPFLYIPMLFGFERTVRVGPAYDDEQRKIVVTSVTYLTPTKDVLATMEAIQIYLLEFKIPIPISYFTLDPNIRPNYSYPSQLWQQPIFEPDISNGKEKIPITALCGNTRLAENWKLPEYITECIADQDLGVTLDHDDEFLSCCDCTDGCKNKLKCTCCVLTLNQCSQKKREALGDTNIGYKYHRLHDQLMSGIYECNKRCKCAATCENRVVQNGTFCQLQLFMTKFKGWGVRTLVDIPKGLFVSTYIGKIVSSKYADEVSKVWRSTKWKYLSCLDLGEVDKDGYESDCVEPKDPITIPSPPSFLSSGPSPPAVMEETFDCEEESQHNNSPSTSAVIEGTFDCEDESQNNISQQNEFKCEFMEPLQYPSGESQPNEESQRVPSPSPTTSTFTSSSKSTFENAILEKKKGPKLNPLFQLTFTQSSFMSNRNQFSTGACILGKRTPKVTQTAWLQPIAIPDPDEVTKYIEHVMTQEKTIYPVELVEAYKKIEISYEDAYNALEGFVAPDQTVRNVPEVPLTPSTPTLSEEVGEACPLGIPAIQKKLFRRKLVHLTKTIRSKKINPFCRPRRKARRKRSNESWSKRQAPSRKKPVQKLQHELLRLDCNVDGHDMSNVGRYINHSCDPNLFPQFVFTNSHDLRFPTIAFFAKRNIYAGEELGWDYNYEFGDSYQMLCKCGALNCKSRLC